MHSEIVRITKGMRKDKRPQPRLRASNKTPESRNNGARRNNPLLGNGWINKFPRQQTRDATKEELLEAVFPMRSVTRLYNEATKRVTKAKHIHKRHAHLLMRGGVTQGL
jgi:hypothetical protein